MTHAVSVNRVGAKSRKAPTEQKEHQHKSLIKILVFKGCTDRIFKKLLSMIPDITFLHLKTIYKKVNCKSFKLVNLSVAETMAIKTAILIVYLLIHHT